MDLKPLKELTDELGKLPGIGPKSAHRIAFHLLKQPQQVCDRLASVIAGLKQKLMPCRNCFHLSETGVCSVCSDPSRSSLVCVVEDVGDVLAIERTGEYHGRYHVLTGVISPLDGIGPENIKIRELLERIDAEHITEVLMATNFTVEGEATAVYISKLLKAKNVKVYRLAHGLPVGGSLEHADEATMAKALENRKEMN